MLETSTRNDTSLTVRISEAVLRRSFPDRTTTDEYYLYPQKTIFPYKICKSASPKSQADMSPRSNEHKLRPIISPNRCSSGSDGEVHEKAHKHRNGISRNVMNSAEHYYEAQERKKSPTHINGHFNRIASEYDDRKVNGKIKLDNQRNDELVGHGVDLQKETTLMKKFVSDFNPHGNKNQPYFTKNSVGNKHENSFSNSYHISESSRMFCSKSPFTINVPTNTLPKTHKPQEYETHMEKFQDCLNSTPMAAEKTSNNRDANSKMHNEDRIQDKTMQVQNKTKRFKKFGISDIMGEDFASESKKENNNNDNNNNNIERSPPKSVGFKRKPEVKPMAEISPKRTRHNSEGGSSLNGYKSSSNESEHSSPSRESVFEGPTKYVSPPSFIPPQYATNPYFMNSFGNPAIQQNMLAANPTLINDPTLMLRMQSFPGSMPFMNPYLFPQLLNNPMNNYDPALIIEQQQQMMAFINQSKVRSLQQANPFFTAMMSDPMVASSWFAAGAGRIDGSLQFPPSVNTSQMQHSWNMKQQEFLKQLQMKKDEENKFLKAHTGKNNAQLQTNADKFSMQSDKQKTKYNQDEDSQMPKHSNNSHFSNHQNNTKPSLPIKEHSMLPKPKVNGVKKLSLKRPLPNVPRLPKKKYCDSTEPSQSYSSSNLLAKRDKLSTKNFNTKNVTSSTCPEKDEVFKNILKKTPNGPTSGQNSNDSGSSPTSKSASYKNLTRERRLVANARERTRVHTISSAFEDLRNQIPSYSCNQKLSKLAILRIACSYIKSLSILSGYDVSGDTKFDESVESCTKVLQSESRARSRRKSNKSQIDWEVEHYEQVQTTSKSGKETAFCKTSQSPNSNTEHDQSFENTGSPPLPQSLNRRCFGRDRNYQSDVNSPSSDENRVMCANVDPQIKKSENKEEQGSSEHFKQDKQEEDINVED